MVIVVGYGCDVEMFVGEIEGVVGGVGLEVWLF